MKKQHWRLSDYQQRICCRCSVINNAFAVDAVLKLLEKAEFKVLFDSLHNTTKAYKMDIGPEDIKTITNNQDDSEMDVKVYAPGINITFLILSSFEEIFHQITV